MDSNEWDLTNRKLLIVGGFYVVAIMLMVLGTWYLEQQDAVDEMIANAEGYVHLHQPDPSEDENG